MVMIECRRTICTVRRPQDPRGVGGGKGRTLSSRTCESRGACCAPSIAAGGPGLGGGGQDDIRGTAIRGMGQGVGEGSAVRRASCTA